MDIHMSRLTRPLYRRSEGADDDRWLLVLDTDASRLYVEHVTTRGDMRGPRYATRTSEIEIGAFLSESGPGQDALLKLLAGLLEDRTGPAPRCDHVGLAPLSMT
jgi:hypothetical protein